MAVIRSCVAGVFACLAVPSSRRMPRRTAFTASALVGGSKPCWRWTWPMPEARRPIVDGRSPVLAREDR